MNLFDRLHIELCDVIVSYLPYWARVCLRVTSKFNRSLVTNIKQGKMVGFPRVTGKCKVHEMGDVAIRPAIMNAICAGVDLIRGDLLSFHHKIAYEKFHIIYNGYLWFRDWQRDIPSKLCDFDTKLPAMYYPHDFLLNKVINFNINLVTSQIDFKATPTGTSRHTHYYFFYCGDNYKIVFPHLDFKSAFGDINIGDWLLENKGQFRYTSCNTFTLEIKDE